jgi:hypothetical protein
MKNALIFFGVTSLLIVGSLSLVDAVSPGGAQGWTAISREEAGGMIGAVGPCQDCVPNSTECPDEPDPGAGFGCKQIYDAHTGFWTCVLDTSQSTGPATGCSESGTFRDCSWAPSLWCSNTATGNCGNYVYLYCSSSYGICTGYIRIADSGNPCKYDCQL